MHRAPAAARLLLGALALIALLVRPATAQPVKVVSLDRAEIGGATYFRLEIERPADMGTLTTERPRWEWDRRRGRLGLVTWPRIPELSAQPAYQHPCYYDPRTDLSDRSGNTWQEAEVDNRPTFFGRTTSARPTLTLRYPGTPTKTDPAPWIETQITLDVAAAREVNETPSLESKWAEAQAAWFDLMGATTDDPTGFYTYAAVQSRRQHGLAALTNPAPDWWESDWGRPWREQTYALATGALAVQESLQLDRMLTGTTRQPESRTVDISSIEGVTVKSHPFDEMRKGAEPVGTPLAAFVPEANYFARFSSVDKLMQLIDFSEEWGGSLLRLTNATGADFQTRERTLRQLCLPDNVLTRALGPAVVSEVAVTGSDAFLRMGSDITVLFDVKARAPFTVAVDAARALGISARPGAAAPQVSTSTHAGITIESAATPDRAVSCHRAWIGDVCVYSNSLIGVERVIDAHAGSLPRLADSPDYRYMRAAVFPFDAAHEDGFVFLSDAFIRALVGPETRIKQQRRTQAFTSLRMLTNARMLHGYTRGPGDPTFEELVSSGSLSADDLFDPDGGTFTWNAPLQTPVSTVWGTPAFMTPLIEARADKATETERAAYDRFREQYQTYWRRFFDPIGIRLVIDRTVTIETHILPLIDLSRYQSARDFSGGDPISVDLSTFTPKTLFRVVSKFNDGQDKRMARTWLSSMTGTNAGSDWLGDWVTFWVEDSPALLALARSEFEPVLDEDGNNESAGILDVFNAAIVGGAHVTNKVSLAAFLIGAKAAISSIAPNTVLFSNLEPYKGISIVRIYPDPAGDLIADLRNPQEDEEDGQAAKPPAAPDPEAPPSFFYATIGDGFYLATRPDPLRALIDRLNPPTADASATPATPSAPATPPAPDTALTNMLLFASPGAAGEAREAASYILARRADAAATTNLRLVWLLGRCSLLAAGAPLDDAALKYLYFRPVAPNGGTFEFDAATGEPSSAMHGTLHAPVRHDALPAGSPLFTLLDSLRALVVNLRFTDDGLHSRVEIRRH